MIFDLLLAEATVVTPEGAADLDVAIEGEQVAAIGRRGSLDGLARRVMTLAGKLIVPGGIDPHVHCNWPINAGSVGDTAYTAGPSPVSRAALHGGTTMLIDFAVPDGAEPLQAALQRHISEWSGACHCDFAFHLLLQGRLAHDAIDDLPAIVAGGCPSFKVFTTNVRPSVTGRRIDYGSLWEIMRQVAEHNGLVAVHAEDEDLVMYMYDKLITQGRVGIEHMPQAHSSLSEDLAFRRVIRLAENVPGTPLYIMHVSARTGVEAVAEARSRGLPVYAETLHQYALRTADKYLEPDGVKYHTYPSLRLPSDTDALWQGITSGAIDTIATDELCTSYTVKTQGHRIDDAIGGNTGVEPRMAIVYTEAVTKRKLSLGRFVDLTSANAARILGMYPRKGAIAVGSDADLTVLDPAARRTITAESLHESDYTPWEGWEVSAWPVMTLLRGKVVVEGGRFEGAADDGRFIARELDPSVHLGTATT